MISNTGAELGVCLYGLVSIRLWKQQEKRTLLSISKKYARIMGLLSVTKSNIRSQQLLNGAASWPKIFHGLQLHTGWPLYKYHSLEVELPLRAVREKHLTV